MTVAEFDITTGETIERDLTPEELAQVEVNKRASMMMRANTLIDHTDLIALRCFKAGVDFPPDWNVWSGHLRLVIRGVVALDETLKPLQYPPGT